MDDLGGFPLFLETPIYYLPTYPMNGHLRGTGAPQMGTINTPSPATVEHTNGTPTRVHDFLSKGHAQ